MKKRWAKWKYPNNRDKWNESKSNLLHILAYIIRETVFGCGAGSKWKEVEEEVSAKVKQTTQIGFNRTKVSCLLWFHAYFMLLGRPWNTGGAPGQNGAFDWNVEQLECNPIEHATIFKLSDVRLSGVSLKLWLWYFHLSTTSHSQRARECK